MGILTEKNSCEIITGIRYELELFECVKLWLQTRKSLGHNIRWVQGIVCYDDDFNQIFLFYDTQNSYEYIGWYIDFNVEIPNELIRSIKRPTIILRSKLN
jgi:hypothetical protein